MEYTAETKRNRRKRNSRTIPVREVHGLLAEICHEMEQSCTQEERCLVNRFKNRMDAELERWCTKE